MKKLIFYWFVLAFLPQFIFAQNFTFKCTFKNTRQPELLVVPQNNILLSSLYHRVPLIKDSDSSAHISLQPSKIAFYEIGGDVILVSPGEHAEGILNGSDFEPNDTNSINFTLKDIAKGFSNIVVTFRNGDNFAKFKTIVPLLTKYIDSTNNTLTIKEKPWLNANVVIALKEYLSTRLAHFLVLPIKFDVPFEKNELEELIRKNVQIKYPEYWLQLQPGRIFLETYYRKMSLPNTDFNLRASLQNKYFLFPAVRKLAYYNYFLACLDNGTVKTKAQLLSDFQQLKSKVVFSNAEQDVMKDVYKKINQIGENIDDVFATLPIENLDGNLLTTEEKKALISGKNIILDFWASWCEPCRAKMTKLNSDHATIARKTYRIIYLSIDEDNNNWKGAKFSFLNKKNSFRITGPDNQFVKDYSITAIPRYMLVNEGTLISSEFHY